MNVLTHLQHSRLLLVAALSILAATVVGLAAMNPWTTSAAACVASGLYGSNSGGGPSSLYNIDPTTGAGTVVGAIGFRAVGSLDFHPTNNDLYGTGRRPGDGTAVLITIDPCTGVPSPTQDGPPWSRSGNDEYRL